MTTRDLFCLRPTVVHPRQHLLPPSQESHELSAPAQLDGVSNQFAHLGLTVPHECVPFFGLRQTVRPVQRKEEFVKFVRRVLTQSIRSYGVIVDPPLCVCVELLIRPSIQVFERRSTGGNI